MQCEWNVKVSDKPLYGTCLCQASVRVYLVIGSVISCKELLQVSHMHQSLTSFS